MKRREKSSDRTRQHSCEVARSLGDSGSHSSCNLHLIYFSVPPQCPNLNRKSCSDLIEKFKSHETNLDMN